MNYFALFLASLLAPPLWQVARAEWISCELWENYRLPVDRSPQIVFPSHDELRFRQLKATSRLSA